MLILAAGTKNYLQDIRLELDDSMIILHVKKAARPLFDAACARRFNALAASAGRQPQVVFCEDHDAA